MGILLFSIPAAACDSYEDCLRLARANSGNLWNSDNQYRRATSEQYFLEAICLKLDEISKKLDKEEFDPEEKKALHEAALIQRAAHRL